MLATTAPLLPHYCPTIAPLLPHYCPKQRRMFGGNTTRTMRIRKLKFVYVFRVVQNVCHLIFFHQNRSIYGNIGVFIPPYYTPYTPPYLSQPFFFLHSHFPMPLNVFRVAQNVCHLLLFQQNRSIYGNIGVFSPPYYTPYTPPYLSQPFFSFTFSGMPLNVFRVSQNVCHLIFLKYISFCSTIWGVSIISILAFVALYGACL